MAEEDKVDPGADEQTGSREEPQITKEELEAVINERLEKERKEWQSRFDKLRSEKSDIEQKYETASKSWEQRMEEEVSGVRKELESQKQAAAMERLRTQAIKTVSGAGLDLDDVEEKLVYKLIDPQAEDPLADVQAYVEREKAKAEKIKMSAADEYTKKNGRKVDDGKPGYKTLDDYTAEEIKRMSADEFEKIFERSKQT